MVLSACYSEAQAEALLAHVTCVVGMGGSFHEDAARSFALGFYGCLGERESIAAAYKQGCAAISLEGCATQIARNWSDPAVCLRELRCALRVRGRLVVGFRERSGAAIAALPPSIYRLYGDDEVITMLRDAGFSAELRKASSAEHLRIAVGVAA